MDSAFKGVEKRAAASIRKMLLAGSTMIDVRNSFHDKNGRRLFNAQRMREMRDEVFEPLRCDPDKVKALANGPLLNANEIVRYKEPVNRHARMARPRSVQAEMFPA